jgi:pilus assembly protein FimV
MAQFDKDDDTLISQEDIDELLNSSFLDGEDSLFDARQDEMPGGTDDDEIGELSQNDIDSLLNTVSRESESSQEDELAASVEDTPDDDYQDDDDYLELVSLDDIERLMGVGSQENSDGADTSSALEEDKPMDEEPVQPPPDPRFEPGLDQEMVIDESQAVSIEDNLVSQATIDRLLAGAPQPDLEFEFASEQVSFPEPGPSSEIEPDPTPDLSFDRLSDSEPDPASNMAPGPPPSTFAGDEIDTIAQEDIDDLLREDSPDDGSDRESQGDDLISQDDIDELLNTSEEEDEDIIGDLDNDLYMTTDPGEEEDDHQVVLEEAGKDLSPAQASSDSPVPAPVHQWYQSRHLMAACLAVVMVLAALPMVYFGFFAEKKSDLPSMTQVDGISEPGRSEVLTVQPDLAGENMAQGGVTQRNLAPRPGNIILENFVLLVPNGKTGISYVTASLSIDYSDARAANEINDHLPLYRDIVFEAMGKVLASQKIDKVTEADFLSNIKAALNLNLSGTYVEQVNFSAFTTG